MGWNVFSEVQLFNELLKVPNEILAAFCQLVFVVAMKIAVVLSLWFFWEEIDFLKQY